MDLNKVMIIGRLTRDPELRTTPGGINVCNVGVATGYAYMNKQTNQKVEQTEFHNIVLFGKLADIANQYLKKGAQIYFEGRLQTRSWEGKDGQKKNRSEIIADNMIMLGKATGSQAPSGPQSSFAGNTASKTATNTHLGAPLETEELPTIQQDEDINVEDIPF